MDAQQVIDMVTQRVKDTANVETVFGKPIESGGVTLIPVACVKVSGGGGGGSGKPKGGGETDEKDKGMGLGLHVTATPVGFIQIADGKAQMVDIVDKTKVAVGGLVAGGLFVITLAKMAYWRSRHAA